MAPQTGAGQSQEATLARIALVLIRPQQDTHSHSHTHTHTHIHAHALCTVCVFLLHHFLRWTQETTGGSSWLGLNKTK